MDRIQKEEMVAELKEAFEGSEIVVVSKQSGLSVAEAQTLRRAMRAEGATLKVAKNRLVKIAVQDTSMEGLSEFMTGTTAISYGTDPVAPAKVLADFAKENDKIEILGAVMGDKVLSAAEVNALAKLPSLDQLRSKIIGVIQAPATKVAGVVQAPAGQLARVFAAFSAKEAA
ncbi:MAG: 50S ribosomal protein L10 [Alphaproteobacteria bacterium]